MGWEIRCTGVIPAGLGGNRLNQRRMVPPMHVPVSRHPKTPRKALHDAEMLGDKSPQYILQLLMAETIL